jgi:4-hydroxy-4-methyl-2-oxoglutarate aldolase
MTLQETATLTLEQVRESLYSAVLSDALDAMGFTNQCPRLQLRPYTGINKLVGRCKTTLWVDMAHEDPRPYDLELRAVDSCRNDDVMVAAAGGSMRSGIWGELLSTAASNNGCAGALVHGTVRDVTKMTEMGFPVFAAGTNPFDSLNRQRVVDMDVPVEMGGVQLCPGDLVFADLDGIVVVPRKVEAEVLERAWQKVTAENRTRDAIRQGMKAVAAYEKYGVL